MLMQREFNLAVIDLAVLHIRRFKTSFFIGVTNLLQVMVCIFQGFDRRAW
jgi:hypothetical protein